MAAPNLAGVTSILGKTIGSGALTTDATTTIVTCPIDKVLKINSIVAANYGGSDSASITLGLYDSPSTYYLSYDITVPNNSSLIVSSKENSLYLQEGTVIRASASEASALSLIISYDEIGDD